MTILHLGVVDVPYAEAPASPRPERVASGTQTTGDVAGWLENKYHVMEVFFLNHEGEIADDLANEYAGALETLMMGGPVNPAVLAGEIGSIHSRFQTFIDQREMEGLGIPGVPTAAAIKGIRRRFKRRLDPGRPSFQDTALYETNFMAWVD